MASTALLAFLATLAASPASAEAWRTYANERFGTTVEYPARFSVLDEPPANSDGQRFRTREGSAVLAVYGSFNVENRTMRQLMEAAREAGRAYSYAAADARRFTLSGTAGGRISYMRCALSDRSADIVGCFVLEYPAGEARAWDGIVTRLARSLRFGKPW